MGRIIKRIARGGLAVAIAAGLLPVGAVSAAAVEGNVESVVDLHGAQVTSVEDISGDPEGMQASSLVNILGYEDDSNAFAIRLKHNVVADKPDGAEVWVETANGSASGKGDAAKQAAYSVTWMRTKLDASNVEGELETLTGSSASADTVQDSPDAHSDKSQGLGESATLYERFSHPIGNDDLDSGVTYRYYVRIVDNMGTPSNPSDDVTITNWADNESARQPITVTVGSGNMYTAGSIKNSPWTVSGDADTGAYIYKKATLSVDGFETTAAQNASSIYKALAEQALKEGKTIAGEVSGDSGAVPGTAAWRVTITDVDSNNDAFLGSILVTLDLNDGVLDMLGGSLPSDFLDKYTLMHAGGANVKMSGLVLEKDEGGNPTGRISFYIDGTSSFNAGDLGVFALVRALDPEHDAMFTVTPQLAAGGGGRITPMEEREYKVGAEPSYTFDYNKGYEVSSVALYYTYDASTGGPVTEATADADARQATYTMTYAKTNMNSLTFDAALAKRVAAEKDGVGQVLANYEGPWQWDVRMVVAFSAIDDSDAETYTVTIANIDGGGSGSVKIGGVEVTRAMIGQSGAAVELEANKGHDITFVPDEGSVVSKVQVASKSDKVATDKLQQSDWVTVSTVGRTYSISKLVSYMWISVTFEPKVIDEPTVKHMVSVDVKSGKGRAEFSKGQTSLEVIDGNGCSINVWPGDDKDSNWELGSAEAFYVSGGIESGGNDLMSSYTAPANAGSPGVIQLSNVTCEMVVRLTFVEKSSGGEDNPGGVVTPPDRAKAVVTGIRSAKEGLDLTDPSNAGPGGVATSTPDMGDETPYPVGYKQSFSFFYYTMMDGDGNEMWWVIDHLEITYYEDNDLKVPKSTQKLAAAGAVNTISLTVDGPMTITAVLRAPAADGSDETHGPDDANAVVSTPVVAGGSTAVKEVDIVVDGSTVKVEAPVLTVVPKNPVTGATIAGAPTVEIILDPNDPSKAAMVEGAGGVAVPSGRFVDDDPSKGIIYKPETSVYAYDEDQQKVVKVDEVPYVDANGSIVGNGGAYDPETGTWEPGGTIDPAFAKPMPGPQTIVLEPTDSKSPFYYWTVDEVIVDGVLLVDGKNVVGGEVVIFDRAEGTVSFEDVEKPHDVSVSFERAIELDIDLTVEANAGDATATSTTWHVYKDMEGRDSLRIGVAPERGKKIEHFYIDTTSEDIESGRITGERLAARDRVGAPGWVKGISEDSWNKSKGADAQIGGLSDITRSASSASSDGLIPSAWADTLVPSAWADEGDVSVDIPSAVLSAVPSAWADEGGIDLSEGCWYTLDAAKDFFGQLSDPTSHLRTVNRTSSVPSMPFYAVLSDTNGGGGNGGGDVGGNGGGGNGSGADADDSTSHTITARVVSGKGTVNGAQAVDVAVEHGGTRLLSLAPEPGWQVVRVTDGGKQRSWTNNTYPVENVTEDREVLIEFAMVSAAGDNSSGGRVIRRITAMLATGDGMLPITIATVGVAFGALGVALLLSKRRRDE